MAAELTRADRHTDGRTWRR